MAFTVFFKKGEYDMRLVRNTLHIMVYLLFINATLVAQWIQTGDLRPVTVNCLTTSGDSVFAGTDNGVYLTTDGGASWHASGLNGTTLVFALAVNGRHIFAGAGTGDVYISSDGGGSWTLADNGLGTGNPVSGFVVLGSAVFEASYSIGGIYRSTDNGANWALLSSTSTFGQIVALIVSGSNLLAAEKGGPVYFSTDSGSTWTASTLSGASSMASEGSKVIAVSYGTAYLSTDNGATWSVADSSFPSPFTVTSLVIQGQNILAGTNGDGVYLSTNNGTSWTSVNNGLQSTDIQCLASAGGSVFAGAWSGGVFTSTNGGSAWSQASNGMGPNEYPLYNSVFLLGTYDSTIVAGALRNGVYLSTDNGSNWTISSAGLPTSYGDNTFMVHNMKLFLGTNNGVYVSTDNGGSWNADTLGMGTLSVESFGSDGADLVAGTSDHGVFLSTDGGTSWIQTNLAGIKVAAFAMSSSGLFAGTGNGVFLSTNAGATWIQVNSGLTDTIVNTLVSVGSNLFAGTESGVFLSTNDGTGWMQMNSGITNTHVRSLVISGTDLFAGTFGGGIFLSTNTGATWTQVNTGLPHPFVLSLAIGGTNLFAGTDSAGVWRRPLSEMITAVKGNPQVVPLRFSLSQNYPNPFNPTTVIAYELPARSSVTLKVYDVLGREVRTLVNESQNAGKHSVTFDAANLPSGVYLCRLTAGSFSATRKLALVK